MANQVLYLEIWNIVGREIVNIHAFYEQFFFLFLFETWNNGKKLEVSIRQVKIVKIRTCVKCFETLNP